MKITLTKDDQEQIQYELQSSSLRVLTWLKTFRPNVGDILIKSNYTLDDNNNVESSTYSYYDNSILPIRYLVVSFDKDSNVFFYKTIEDNGKLCKELYSTADMIDCASFGSFSLFEVDPLYVDAIIMGDEFDIGHLLKQEAERKKDLISKNRKASSKFSSLKEVNAFIKTLSKGDTIYYHAASDYGFNDNSFVSLTVDQTRKLKVDAFKHTKRYDRLCGREQITEKNLNDRHVLYLRDSKRSRLISSAELIGQAIYKNKPFSLTEKS